MIRMILSLALFGASLAFCIPQKVSVDGSTVHSRNYSFSFTNGNLLPNWSFEDGYYGWDGYRLSKEELAYMTQGTLSPVTGSYVGVSSTTKTTISPSVPVEGGSAYSLSLFVASTGTGSEKPKISFYSSRYIFLSDTTLSNYPMPYEKWRFYSAKFTVPAAARYAKVVLGKSHEGILLFDDVVLEKGSEPSSRNSTDMQIEFSDALNHVHMKEALLRRTNPIELIPRNELANYAVYAKERVEIWSRAKVFGGNIASGHNIFIDNDVTVRDGTFPGLRVDAKDTVQLGDRDSLYADVRYGKKLKRGHRDYVRYSEKSESVGVYDLDFGDIDVGTDNVTVKSDSSRTLAPGAYKDVKARTRGTLHLSAGSYYFRKFTLDPNSVVDFDFSQGNVRIYVQSELKIYDHVQMNGDTLSKNYVLWNVAQTSTLKLGSDSRLMGLIVAPKARVELGDRSFLTGAIYARKAYLMHDSRVNAPSLLFEQPRNIYAVSENRYDVMTRKYQSDKAYVAELDSEGYVLSSLVNADNYYSPAGDGADAGGFAYSETIYSTKDGHVLKRSVPGAPWNVNGPHAGSSYETLVSDLSIPSSLNFGAHPGDSLYTLSATEDAEGRVSLSWKNRLGQIVQEAEVVDTVGQDMRNWNWAVKRFEYTREGKLRRVLTPLDNKYNDSLFAIVSEYDGAGREISRTAPDVGRESFYYDVNGNVRFSQTAEQRLRNAFTYTERDAQGRVVSVGESVLPGLSDDQLRAVAFSGAATPGTKMEYLGRAYDKLSRCTAAIGDAALEALVSGVDLQNTRSRLVCAWSRNPKLYGLISAGEALVADFFGYDSEGRVSVTYRYTGAERDASCKLVSKMFTNDDRSKLEKISVRNASGLVISERYFDYDVKGRVSAVKDASGKLLAAYTYDDFGRKSAVNVGNAFRMDYGYHLHGAVNSLKAVELATSDVLYEQRVNYENIEGSDGMPRYDGRVSQVKSTMNTPDSTFSDDFVYIYDMMGNMRTSSGAGSSVTFSYDENGRMLSQGYAPQRQALSYVYGAGSYAVSRATGNTPLDENRNASRTNNFSYDASGRMVHDSSKGLSVTYGMDGLPVLFEQTDSSGAWREISVYDPSGWRVATYSYADGNLVSLRTDIMLDGRKELERRRAYAGNDSSVTEYAMLYGNGAMLGRRHGNGSYEWYVKDRQGSLVMSLVDEKVGSALAYEPYGYLHLRRASGSVPAEQYTGKEYDGRLGLYYFGARFFDPTFAMWLTPDPARQYLNPYSYGGDPVNGLDPDGRWGLLSGFVPIFSIVSAIYSASTSSESVGEWFGTAAIDYFGNNICATVEPAATGISVVWGALSTVGAFGRAITGNGEWGDVLKPFAISIFSSLQSDWNSVNNSFAAVGRGDLGEFFTNMSSSGVNGLATDYNAFQYSANKGFGSQEYTYEFSVEGSGGHKNIIWGQKTNDPKNGGRNAENLGQNIVLYKPYYEKSDEEKKSILIHEFVHARQQSKFGFGGIVIRHEWRIRSRPGDYQEDCSGYGLSSFSCEDIRGAFTSYGDGKQRLNMADIEAEAHQNAGENSKYWFDAPVFY